MSPVLAAVSIILLLIVAVVTGVVLRRRDGSARRHVRDGVVTSTQLGAELAARATLVQFSTEVCARCPAVRRLLGEVAGTHPGVAHVEVDLTRRPDLAQRFRVLQTPTTLVLDAGGTVRARFGGAPTRAAVERELAHLIGDGARV